MEQLRYYQDEIGNIYEVKTDLEKKIILDIIKKQDEIDKQKEVLDKIKEIMNNVISNGEEIDQLRKIEVKKILELLEEIE